MLIWILRLQWRKQHSCLAVVANRAVASCGWEKTIVKGDVFYHDCFCRCSRTVGGWRRKRFVQSFFVLRYGPSIVCTHSAHPQQALWFVGKAGREVWLTLFLGSRVFMDHRRQFLSRGTSVYALTHRGGVPASGSCFYLHSMSFSCLISVWEGSHASEREPCGRAEDVSERVQYGLVRYEKCGVGFFFSLLISRSRLCSVWTRAQVAFGSKPAISLLLDRRQSRRAENVLKFLLMKHAFNMISLKPTQARC